MSSRLSFWAVVVVLVASAGPVAADAPSPLDLVRGLREAGLADLAMEYLKDAETLPMPENDKKALLLERAKCLLDLAEDEPDEGTRTGMVSEAKEAFTEFVTRNANHPRVSEASIALARLTSIDAKIQLNRARRMDVGDDTELKERQRKESEASRPLFVLASKRFAEAAAQIKAKIADPATDPLTKSSLAREAFEAELASAINQYLLADTFLATDAKQTIERSKYLDEARQAFSKLATSPTSRTAWVARAWMAETLMDQSKTSEADVEFKAILASTIFESEDGKRMVRFFMARRNYLSALQDRTPAKLQASEKELRAWKTRYSVGAKPSAEAFSIKYYLAFILSMQADIATPTPKTGPLVVGATALRQYDEAEKIYRELSQTDNDYTTRASRYRMHVVRMLLGDAEKPANEYFTFEKAQMAALIQMAKLSDAEKAQPALESKVKGLKGWGVIGTELARLKGEAEIKTRRIRILALLERARELASDKDSAGDVTDNLLRLVYFYETNNQPFQAAVLGEHVCRSIRSTGGKAAMAGLLGMNGYLIAASKIKVDTSDPEANKKVIEAAEAARRQDRDRAMLLARFLDEKFPNDQATDAARHRLASMLVEDRKLDEAFMMIIKIRAGYSQLASVRLLEGYIASSLITSQIKDIKLPTGGKPFIFRQAINDLSRVVKPVTAAKDEEVKGYLSVRARLAFLYLSQSRIEDGNHNSAPAYQKALEIADEIIGVVPTYDCLKEGDGKLNPKGLEMYYLGLDARTRAIYLIGKARVDAKDHNWEEAAKAIEPAIADVEKSGAMYDDTMKKWAGDPGEDEAGKVKIRVAALAQGIDRTRREIIMVDFKLRVRQGKPEDAKKMLELLEKAGGSIEENQPTLEFMARDLAAQIPMLKRTGQAAEAKAMGDGLAILLTRLGAIPNQPASSTLFLGQTLYLVERFDDALKEFAKIPVPVPPKPAAPPATPAPKAQDWWTIDVNKLENDAGGAKRKFQEQIRDYRIAQLFTSRCYRGVNKLPEAEKLLTAAIGTTDKQGFAYASLDFRKELAMVYEAKGAAIAAAKEANVEWGKALKEWTTLFNFAAAQVSKLKDQNPEQERTVKSAYFEAYYEIQRCLLLANNQLLKGNPKLAQTYADVAKKIVGMETSNKLVELEKKGNGIVTPEVWNKYCDLLDKYPDVKKAYKETGGKLFLDRPVTAGGQ